MGRLCQNIRRRNGVYWFTKKLRTRDGVARVEFSLNTREPRIATMVGAQINAQFYVLSERVLSGQIDIESFRDALAEIAVELAQSRRHKMFETLVMSRHEVGGSGSGAELDELVKTDVAVGRLVELIARYGEAMRDANFFIDILDENGFDDQQISVLLATVLPRIGDWMGLLAGVADQIGVESGSNLSHFERSSVIATVGRTMVKAAEEAARQDIVGIDDIASHAVGSVYNPPAPKLTISASSVVSLSPVGVAATRPISPPEITSLEKHPFILGLNVLLKPAKDEKPPTPRDMKDVIAIAYLFAEFLIEQQIFDLRQLCQKHFADFRDLFDDLPTHWDKSSRDRCLADYRKRGATLPKSQRGLSAKTWNKHISSLNQVITSIRNNGGVVGEKGEFLDPNAVRLKIKKRARNLRNAFETEDLAAVFNLPVFTGCTGWDRKNPFTPGPHIFHRALYFAPMLLYYTGARRDEICGLMRHDVHLDVPIPFIHIRENSQRDIKNEQSDRRIPIHSEILRLGFAEYVAKVASLKYDLIFPDLYSSTTASPLGDRLYNEIADALAEAVPEEGKRKKVLHSLRRTVGSVLKEGGIVSEQRADLLGHKGKTTTDETYASQSSLATLRDLIHRLPVATAHLASKPIQLVPWVARKEPAPWGRKKAE